MRADSHGYTVPATHTRPIASYDPRSAILCMPRDKPMTTPSQPFRPSGSLEFEHIEVESLIRKNRATGSTDDDKIDADPLSINFGRAKDHVAAPAEALLEGPTIDWLVSFPMGARPKALCERYPHVANRLARAWSDAESSMRLVRQLAADPRWGSVGHPALIQDELKRLLQAPTLA